MKNSFGKRFLMIFGSIAICCASYVAKAQTWSTSGDTISSSGYVKATALNVTGSNIIMKGLVSDTTTDLLGISKQGNLLSLKGVNLINTLYPNAPPYMVTCDTTHAQWYRQLLPHASALVTRECGWVGVGEAGKTGLPDAALSVANSTLNMQFSVVNPATGTTDVFNVDKLGNTYAAGNVGIATTTPNAELGISMPADPSYPAFSITNSSGNVFNIDQYGNANIKGNVLIQTTNNEYALNVGGVIWSHEVEVCISGCDFVFGKDYKLMPLKDLQQYLQANQHLPGIASAKEMESGNGVALGKMDSQLLQKVEELTLYLLQQQQKMEEQQKEINELKELVLSLQKNNH